MRQDQRVTITCAVDIAKCLAQRNTAAHGESIRVAINTAKHEPIGGTVNIPERPTQRDSDCQAKYVAFDDAKRVAVGESVDGAHGVVPEWTLLRVHVDGPRAVRGGDVEQRHGAQRGVRRAVRPGALLRGRLNGKNGVHRGLG